MTTIGITPIGHVSSPIRTTEDAPRQGDEASCEAWIELEPELAPALTGVEVGDRMLVLTWLHLADRDVLQVHPRGDETRPLTGVFATRSPHRPNPIGLHPVTVVERRQAALRVAGLEAVDGTPVVDLKPELGPVGAR